MEGKVSPAKSGLHLGVIFGVVMILESVTAYIIGLQSLANTPFGLVINFLNYLILPILLIYLGCNNYKNKINHGFVSLSECLKIGVSILFLAGLIYAVFNVIFNLIFPEYAAEMMAFAKEEMLRKNPDMSSEQIEMGVSMMQKFSNPYILLAIIPLMYAFIGLLYSLIIGAIVKKDQPQSL